MKKRVLFVVLILVLSFSCLVLFSCGEKDETDYTKIETNGMTYEDGEYKLFVSPETNYLDLANNFRVSENAYFELYRDGNSNSLLDTTVTLNNGSNVFIVKIYDNNSHISEYRLNIYRKQIFTVSFNTNGGTSVNDITIEEGKSIEAPNTFKVGHNFNGWDYDFSNPVTSNLTINAQWTAKDYKITFDVNGEKSVIDIKYGEIYKAPEVDLTGYNFAGWLYNNASFNEEGVYEYTDNIEVVASLQPIEYSIIYVTDSNCTNPNTISKYTINSVIELSNAEWINDEKVFDGWYTDDSFAEEYKISLISNMTGSITLYPKFKDAIITKEIKFSVNGQIVESETKEFTFKQPYEITYVPVIDEFHKFEGWYFEDSLIETKGDLWLFKTDMVLVAKITAREYEIEYVLNGGENNGNNPNSFNADEPFELLDPSYGDHEFVGWYLDASYTNKIENITAEHAGHTLTLHAKWNHRYFVEFDYDGGSGEEQNRLFTVGAPYSLTKPVKNKYVFGGWYYGDTKVELSGNWEYNTSVILKAKWTPKEYIITYNLNGGTQNEQNLTSFNVTVDTITLYDPIWLNNYKRFAGWYLESTYETKIEEIVTIEHEDITLHAKWDEINVSITFDPIIGQVTSNTMSVTVGSNYNLPKAEHANCEFLGWTYNGELIDSTGIWTISDEKITLIAKWNVVEYNINYDLDGGSADGLVNKYTAISEDIILPIPVKEGYTFIGWVTSSGISDSVIIPQGSFGDRSYKASWYKNQDENGFYYELRNGVMVVVGFDKEIDTSKDYVDDIYVPAEYYGYKVTSIDAGAFVQFGEKFVNASYVNAITGKEYKYLDGHQIRGFTKIYLSSEINHIGANAFEGCYGIKVQLYSKSGSVDCRTWDKGVTYELGNVAVRDCIWGFRPALGWSRYSLAEIPEDYE
ncbi:MAG: InlB B-repeat-containing protein [Clostridia bacterium]|nr:InlB B-repeat-containing protein [Clostridia bacterium]